MTLAIFDLDNTLLADDSDYLWGCFLAERGLVDGDFHAAENERFYQQYHAGELDIFEFLRFSLRPLTQHPLAALHQLRAEFLQQKILPVILPKGERLLQQHRDQGDTLMIITATNRFVTEPIAERLGVEHLIAVEPEFIDGRYTGEVFGIPSFQEGKVKRLQQWLAEHPDENLAQSCFYSDSHNDIPLLQCVDRPVAVDPDPKLHAYATEQGWEILSLR